MIDLRAILTAAAPLMFWWGMMVGMITLTGYPGVVCVTPLAWLLGLAAGRTCVLASRTPHKGLRVVEAGLAGAFVGLFQGLVAALVAFFGMPGEQIPGVESQLATNLLLLLITGGAGALVSGGLGMLLGALQLRRLPVSTFSD